MIQYNKPISNQGSVKMNYNVLIVDDEQALSESTCEYLNMFDVKTAWVETPAACLEFFRSNTADLILLDINLGNESGFELCKRLRQTIDIPILFISARTSDDDVLLALNIGGDDYIRKPYSLAVLLAKVKATLKRYKNTPSDTTKTFVSTTLEIDFDLEQVFVHNKKIDLKAMEYKLLEYLVKNPNRTITKDELFESVWGHVITGDNTLNVHIRYLREKIEANPNEPKYIKTVWGKGYLFAGEQE